MTKPVGRALCVGLNRVDQGHYGGWDGKLQACEADARSMGRLLQRQNFETATLTTDSATRGAVITELDRLAAASQPGDLVVWTNSSHGGQLPDLNGDEADGLDETIVLYDGELVDDEINKQLAKFAAGVRVVVISDSCHSGTVTRLVGVKAPVYEPGVKAMPPEVAFATFENNRGKYEPILQAKPTTPREVKASVLLLGGCQDNQLSMDGIYNGAFTAALLTTWRDGLWKGCYKAFHTAIGRRMPREQSPSFYWLNRDEAFANSKPFTF